MNIEWTPCSERMPPDYDIYIVKRMLCRSSAIEIMNKNEITHVVNRGFNKTDIMFTRYTKEKWEFLNR